jgi:hypothetical protein
MIGKRIRVHSQASLPPIPPFLRGKEGVITHDIDSQGLFGCKIDGVDHDVYLFESEFDVLPDNRNEALNLLVQDAQAMGAYSDEKDE